MYNQIFPSLINFKDFTTSNPFTYSPSYTQLTTATLHRYPILNPSFLDPIISENLNPISSQEPENLTSKNVDHNPELPLNNNLSSASQQIPQTENDNDNINKMTYKFKSQEIQDSIQSKQKNNKS